MSSTFKPFAPSLPALQLDRTFPFSTQQHLALAAIEQFLNMPERKLFLLKGFAGTGKSTVLCLLMQHLRQHGWRIAMTAPTNKAVNVLRQMAAQVQLQGVDFMTIHQLLGLSLKSSGGEKRLEPTGQPLTRLYHLVVIDECSMIGTALWAEIAKLDSPLLPTKIVLMGDPAQLNPVGEAKSPSFRVPLAATLTQVVRQHQGSPLAEYIADCRRSVTRSQAPFQPYSHHRQGQGVFRVSQAKLLDYACHTIARQFEQAPDCFRILCFTNRQVDYYNQIVRQAYYGTAAPRFVVGERLITRDPIIGADKKTIVVPTATEIVVQGVELDDYCGYSVWRLQIEIDRDSKQIYVLHESEQDRFDRETIRLQAAAKRNPYLWHVYYKHLETFAQVRPCFALTIHNAQGSTFAEVGIDANDILKRLAHTNEDRSSRLKEYNRLHYVAASRAQRRVLVVYSRRPVAN
ncbi:AAA family ATPase [Microcoleus sp. FACHB-1515]|uniref:ATP-dependent DNA helicase n=1 Tax=Cyanophyceae TaxID=3028117 RepID=UPI0016880969|nr:AAA family ATPase [Microcoleus sp. FACHB-1515]MBD2093324.1 AAA family ATPase [Microcoleus sp. FACHB-1515]